MSVRAVAATGAALGATAVFGVPAAGAATFTVDNTNDAGPNSLRQAVADANAASGPDVVDATGVTGTITLTSGSIGITDAIEINGPGRDNLTVSGDANGNDQPDPYTDSQIFNISNGGPVFASTISGMTLTQGTGIKYVPPIMGPGSEKYIGLDGGAIGANGTDLTIVDSAITGNYATGAGGAVAVFGSGSLTVTGSELSGNTASKYGGAVRASTSGANGLTITGSQFVHNGSLGRKYTDPSGTVSGSGGAISASAPKVTISRSTFTNNDASDYLSGPLETASSRGGGFSLSATSSIDVSDTTVSGNTAAEDGGGGVLTSPDTTISGSSFEDNVAGEQTAAYGGGLATHGKTAISASTVNGNSVDGSGGGVSFQSQESDQGLDLENSTISGNDATNVRAAAAGNGGGLNVATYSYYMAGTPPVSKTNGPVALKNSTIAGNSALGAGGGVYEGVDYAGPGGPPTPVETLSSTIVADNTVPDLDAALVSPGFSAGNSLIESSGAYVTVTSSPPGTNIFGIDPQLAGLANNGGPTLTRQPAATSPALDAGVGNAFATDQRGAGFPRTVDGPAPNAAGSDGTDIGAVERPAAAAPAPAKGTCDGKEPTILGTAGPDKIKGTPGRDVIRGLAGNDKISGLAGEDVICGGSGNDTLRGGAGKDTLIGGAGSDKLIGGGGVDELFAGTPGQKRSQKTNDTCSDPSDKKHGC